MTLERSSDSLRSSVSSPGMPKTYLTPSASRHSTKRSDALRSLIPQLLSRPRVGLTYAIGSADALTVMARFPHALDPRRARLPAGVRARDRRLAADDPRRRLRPRRRDEPVRRLRLREAGRGLPADPRALLPGHRAGSRPRRAATVRVLLQRRAAPRLHRRRARRHARRWTRPRRYRVTRAASDQVDLRAPSGRRIGTFTAPLQVTRRRRHRWRALNGRERHLPRDPRAAPDRLRRQRDQRAWRSTTTSRASCPPSRPPRGRSRR